jgi:ABC-type lipopolysaccharide export system ATPase subunit
LLDQPFSMLAPIQIEPVKLIIPLVKPFRAIVMSAHYYDKVLEMGEASFISKDATLTAAANHKDYKLIFISDSI